MTKPDRVRLAVVAGPTATILNTAPLVTSDQARRRHGLPTRPGDLTFDVLRPQRLVAPVTVYIEAFTGHPLERDAAHLYAPPDGYLDAAGAFSPERLSPEDVAVYEAELRPEDGLYLLPYMASICFLTWPGNATGRPGKRKDFHLCPRRRTPARRSTRTHLD